MRDLLHRAEDHIEVARELVRLNPDLTLSDALTTTNAAAMRAGLSNVIRVLETKP